MLRHVQSITFLLHISPHNVNFVNSLSFKVAYTSGPFFEKIMKRYPIFSLQIHYHQIDQRHQ